MSGILNALFLGGYSFLVLPAIILIAAAFLDRPQNQDQPSRRRLLAFLILTALVLALLDLLIWFNPYGREINSSLPGFGVLIVLVALLGYLLHNVRALASLWSEAKALSAFFVLIFLGLFIFLSLGDQYALMAVVVLSLAAASILYVPRAPFPLLAALSLLSLSALILTTGGWIYIPGADFPAWSRTVFGIITVVSMLLSVLLPAGLFYTSLRVSGDGKKRGLLWSLVLSIILLAGSAYQLFWDGIWSSAHARAFEDHLPFAHFLLSLIAGVLLAILLAGYRKWVGPLYTILVTTVTVFALSWGWSISAFAMTERRAANVDAAITTYYQEHGSYPASLQELSPRYLLVLYPPVVVRTGSWCYQSTGDAYRLGYISGDFTYSEANFKAVTYAQKGSLLSGAWDCDGWLARFEAEELTY